MKDSYTIKDLINLFLNKVWTIVAVTLAFGVAAFCVAEFILPLEYSSDLSMYIQSYQTLNATDENQTSSISGSKQLINTYMAVMKDDAVMAAVSKELVTAFPATVLSESLSISNGEISASSLKSCISISSVTDTSVLKVKVTTKNPELSAAICNALAKVSPKYINDAVHTGTITHISSAKVNNSPVSPNIPKITLIGLMIGFVLIIAEILVIDFFDNTIKNTQELSKKYNKSILGEIQTIGGEKGKKKKKKNHTSRSRNLLTDRTIPFNVIESYKSIRTNITFSLATHDKKIIVVSSANPSEGKSTTAANIAIAFSQMENKVLLIDADMRKPVQHRVFKVSNTGGLSTLIGKMSTLQDSIKRNAMPNLDVLPAGTCPPNPSELLASEQFKEMLSALAANYDYVIIDTPPANVVSDAMVLSDVVGGILLVLKYGSTTYDDVDEAMKKIDLADANMIGFILNDVKMEHRAGYYGRYGKYGYSNYGYRQSSAQAAKTASSDGGNGN
ncbi:MAG: polysaccharide biosynthesis tyrosine autokinase [Clostridia bacterium]|nr:polysaccharide biosynthesis tyrosine autokinase [Clostridia bacterium]